MSSEFIVTVKDVLNRPLFQKAHVVAGENGLHRKIRWVHILEVFNFEALLHGEELILSTGVGLHWSDSSMKSYLEKLIKLGVSCLCLEVGHYFNHVSEEMIEIANRHDFPLIVFHETVRFVDITQDLHSLIINHHHKMLENLEAISREFHRLTLTSQGPSHILKLLQKSTNTQVIYSPVQGNAQYIPSLTIDEQSLLMDTIQKREDQFSESQTEAAPIQWKEDNKTFLLQPVGAMSQTWANLILIVESRDPEEFDLLVLDRASLSLAQDLLRKRYMEERRLHSENLWVDDLIHNRIKSEEQIKTLLGSRFKDVTNLQYRVCLIEIINLNSMDSYTSEDEMEAMRLHMALMVRSIFEKSTFHPLLTIRRNQLIVIAIDLNPKKSNRDRLNKILNLLQTKTMDKKNSEFQLHAGVGRSYKKFMDAYLSYREAQDVLRIDNLAQKSLGPFYEDIGIYRLLLHLENDSVAQLFIDDYLGPLIEQDRSKGSELVYTLKVYFDNHGSKQISAQKLYLTRQTLYHRLNKIKELIGDNFTSPEKRLSIEVAVRAYQLLNPDKFLTKA
jgi:purine catabolism regulator